MCRQFVTSDVTFSFFTADLLVLFAGHAAATFGTFGEAGRAPGGWGTPTRFGVVVYKNGLLKYADENHTGHFAFFHRLICYHTFYKQVLEGVLNNEFDILSHDTSHRCLICSLPRQDS